PGMLVDHHCHLDFPDFADDLDGVIGRAKAAGVGMLVSISTRIRRLDGLLKIAEAYDNVLCSVGTHPHHAHEDFDILPETIAPLALHTKVVGMADAGLAYFYGASPCGAED